MVRDKLTIIGTISEGPATTVYRARQNALNRTILLKVLHKHLLRDPDRVERLRREAAACAALRSEYIVQVYTLEEFDGSPAIVMEYVDGESLHDYLSRTADHSESFARAVANSVLGGLAAAHAQGITHRDIKPANLMVLADGRVKITDFGLAALETSPSLTVEGALIGTPAYMSPEQARGDPVDHRTDLFSLGVTLLEILSGLQLFRGSSYGECINRILRFRTDDIDTIPFTASPEFRGVLKRLLAHDRTERYASAEEALADLGVGARVERSRARRWLSAGIPGAIAASAAIVLALFFSDRQPGEPAAPSAQADTLSVTSPSALDGPPGLQRQEEGSAPALSQAEKDVPPRPVAGKEHAPAGNVVAQTQGTPDSGNMVLTCLPWGKVYLNGTYVGTTPLGGSIRVPAGQHVLTFSNPHFDPILKSITVGQDDIVEVEADFLRGAGYLLVTVSPWAEIYIDEQYRDTTPLSAPLVVSAGTRMIRLRHPAYGDHVVSTAVKAGDTVRVNHRFVPGLLQ